MVSVTASSIATVSRSTSARNSISSAAAARPPRLSRTSTHNIDQSRLALGRCHAAHRLAEGGRAPLQKVTRVLNGSPVVIGLLLAIHPNWPRLELRQLVVRERLE